MLQIILVLWALTIIAAYLYAKRLRQENHDLTEHQLVSSQAIQYNDNRFRSLLNNLPDVVLTFDSKLRLIFYNEVGKHLIDDAELQLLDQTKDGFTLSRTLTRVWFQELLHTLQHQEARIFEFTTNMGKKTLTYEVHAVPDTQKPGDDISIICVIRDITVRKNLEAQRLTIEVERQRIRDMDQLSDQIAHDIRNPLSAIGTSAYLLRRKTDVAEYENQFDKIDLSVRQISKQLDNLLLLTQLNADKPITQKDINLTSFLLQLGAQFEKLARDDQKSLVVDISDLPVIYAEFVYLRTAIEHILYNALNYTSSGDQISLIAFSDNGTTTIKVEDNGLGMTQEQQQHIFERFYRCDPAHARNPYTGGSGLGLSIAESIVHRHNGTLSVSSRFGDGSVFEISITNTTRVTANRTHTSHATV